MDSCNREKCVFLALYSSETLPDSVTNTMDALSAMEDRFDSPDGTAEAIAAMEAPVCEVDACGLSIAGLLGYVTSGGSDIPRQDLDNVVAPSCTLLDIPHDADIDFGRAFPEDPTS